MLSNSEMFIMKKAAITLLVAVVLCSALIASASATAVTVETNVTQDFHVVFTFSDIPSLTYGNITSNGLMTADTLPSALYDNMTAKGFFGVDYYSATIDFNDTLHSIVSAFNLRGPNIVNSTIDRIASTETFRMSTSWRKFNFNITDGFAFNFTRLLAKPLSSWTNATENGVTSFHYSNITDGVPISFTLKLPTYASNIATVNDIITFDTPYTEPVTDQFIDSPMIILIALGFSLMGEGLSELLNPRLEQGGK